jgi:hypothetical protein
MSDIVGPENNPIELKREGLVDVKNLNLGNSNLGNSTLGNSNLGNSNFQPIFGATSSNIPLNNINPSNSNTTSSGPVNFGQLPSAGKVTRTWTSRLTGKPAFKDLKQNRLGDNPETSSIAEYFDIRLLKDEEGAVKLLSILKEKGFVNKANIQDYEDGNSNIIRNAQGKILKESMIKIMSKLAINEINNHETPYVNFTEDIKSNKEVVTRKLETTDKLKDEKNKELVLKEERSLSNKSKLLPNTDVDAVNFQGDTENYMTSRKGINLSDSGGQSGEDKQGGGKQNSRKKNNKKTNKRVVKRIRRKSLKN